MAIFIIEARRGLSLGKLNVNLVGLDHAQFQSRLFFHHFKAFFEVSNLSAQLLIGPMGLFILLLLSFELFDQERDVLNTSTSIPQLGVKNRKQSDQQRRNQAITQD